MRWIYSLVTLGNPSQFQFEFCLWTLKRPWGQAGDHALPARGPRLAPKREAAPDFIRLRLQHAAVESVINAMEVQGLDRCLDHGLKGVKRYVALAVVARNIQRLGALLRQREAERQRGPYRRSA